MTQWYTQTADGIVLVDGDRGTRTPVPSIPSDAVWIGGVAHPPESAEAHHATPEQYWSDDSRFAPSAIQAPNYVEAPGTFDPFNNEGAGTVNPVVESVDYNTDEYADDFGRGPAQGNVTWEFVPDPVYVDPMTDVDQDNEFLQGHIPQATHTGPSEQPWEIGAFVNQRYTGPLESEWELDESAFGTVTGTASNWGYGPNETIEGIVAGGSPYEEPNEGGGFHLPGWTPPDVTDVFDTVRRGFGPIGQLPDIIDAGEAINDEGVVDGLGLNPGNIFGNIGTAIVPLLIFSMIGNED